MSWEKELKIAKSAALTAGHYLYSNRYQKQQINDSVRRDVKLQIDKESESIITDILLSSDSYPILAEESGMTGVASETSPVWVVDPLDGTLNYSKGMDLCCVSIALYNGLTPILGVIYDFNRNELFSGIVGNGAECNGQPIHPSRISKASDAVLFTGFPVNRNFNEKALNEFTKKVQGFKKLRLLGSAALSLTCVACGKADAYMEEDIMLWDIAAGMAIASAANCWTHIHKTGTKPWTVVAQAASDCAVFNH